jgi:hypothetical protein
MTVPKEFLLRELKMLRWALTSWRLALCVLVALIVVVGLGLRGVWPFVVGLPFGVLGAKWDSKMRPHLWD